MADPHDKFVRQTRSWPSVTGNPEQRASKGLSRLEDITRLISEWVWEADVQGRLTYASERVTEVLGWLPLQMQGKTFFELGTFVDEHGNAITPNLEKPFRELRFKTNGRNGEERLLQVSGLPFYDRDTWAIEGYCGTAEDITKQLRMLEEMTGAKLEAEKANLAKSEFLSSMSHELRTPLNGILGFAQLLDYDPTNPLSEKQKDKTDQIIKSGNHLLTLIGQVLELAQIEAGKVTLNIEDVAIRDIFEECKQIIAPMAEKRAITLECNREHCADVFVQADATRLKQIILNLLSNAVKYNRDGGSISISVHTDSGAMVHVAVSDTGLGIAEDKQANLFKPFERLGHEASTIEGTGIGLTITQNLIHLMDGEIGFESRANEGSTFWIDIPQATTIKAPLAEDDANEASDRLDLSDAIADPSKHYTALYVEDNPANLALMDHILGNVPNVDMISAHTAELGIEIAEAQHPDLILMDINLPGINGIEAMKRLHATDATRHIPVIAISAAAMPQDVAKGKDAGFQTYLTKPLDINALMVAIKKALEAR